MPYTFVYNNANSLGVFSFLRQKQELFVSVTSKDYYQLETQNYCDLSIYSRPASCIIDGSITTAWRNGNEINSEFVIDFHFSHFLVTGFSITKPCKRWDAFALEGSNDKEKWILIDNETGIAEGTSYSKFDVKKKSKAISIF